MSKLTPDEILEQCIEAIQTGEKTVSECLRQYPEQKASLEALLPLTQALGQSPNALPRPAFRSQARKQLLSQLPPTSSPSFWSNLFSHFSLASAMVVLVAGFLFSIGFLYLADASAPGDRLYYIDQSIETMRLNWAKNNPEVATNLYNQFAEERLREAQTLAETGDAENAQVALDNYHTTILALTTQEEQVTQEDTPSSTIADRSPLSDIELGSTTVTMADCTYSQGYWKNHVEDWPIAELTIGGVTYTEAELLVILHTPPRGDATYSLMHQLIAVHLNGENGASGGATWLAEADAWLVTHPLGSNPNGEAQQEATSLASSLDDYNNGLLGSIHCDELTMTPTPIVTSTVTPMASSTPVPTITPSPTVTALPSITPTPTIAATPVVTGTSPAPEPTTACTGGTDPHPRGTALANQFGVSYDEIMGWFCSGFGFGEIEQAYSLSQETAVSVTDIFAMKQSGMGWGQIRQELSNDTDNNTGNGNNGNNNNSNGNNGNGNNSNGNNGNNNNSNGNNGNNNNNGNNGNNNNSNGNNGNGNNSNGNNSNGNNGNNNNSNGNNGNGNGNNSNSNNGNNNNSNGNGNKKDK